MIIFWEIVNKYYRLRDWILLNAMIIKCNNIQRSKLNCKSIFCQIYIIILLIFLVILSFDINLLIFFLFFSYFLSLSLVIRIHKLIVIYSSLTLFLPFFSSQHNNYIIITQQSILISILISIFLYIVCKILVRK